jgi:hypothetical protein
MYVYSSQLQVLYLKTFDVRRASVIKALPKLWTKSSNFKVWVVNTCVHVIVPTV